MTNAKTILIFGRKGEGKTTLAVREMTEALREGVFVVSNIKIHWFGDLYFLSGIDRLANIFYKFFKFLSLPYRDKRLQNLYKTLEKLEYKSENVNYDVNGIPDVNLSDLYRDVFNLRAKIDKIKKINDRYYNGVIKEHYYGPGRYAFYEDLEKAIIDLINDCEKHPERKYMLCWDEGFVDLEWGHKPPSFITNFFNQARKLRVDLIVCTQRPVAVYPALRALCDYMVKVQAKWFGRFTSKKYYVDTNPNALPDLSTDNEENDKGEHYVSFKGKEVFAFFDTTQSIGLKRLLNNIIKK